MPPPSWEESRRDGHRAWLLLTYAVFMSLQPPSAPASNGSSTKPTSAGSGALGSGPRMRLREWRVFLKYTSRVNTPVKAFQAKADMDIGILENLFKEVNKEVALVDLLSPRKPGSAQAGRANTRSATPPRARQLNGTHRPKAPATPIPDDEALNKMRLNKLKSMLAEHDGALIEDRHHPESLATGRIISA